MQLCQSAQHRWPTHASLPTIARHYPLLMLFQQAENSSVYVGYWIYHSLAGSRSAMLIPTSMHQNDQIFQVS